MATKVVLNRSDVLRVMGWAQWKAVFTWENVRLAGKLYDLKEIVDDEPTPEDEKTAKTLIEILAGIEAKSELVIVDDKEPEPDDGNFNATVSEDDLSEINEESEENGASFEEPTDEELELVSVIEDGDPKPEDDADFDSVDEFERGSPKPKLEEYEPQTEALTDDNDENLDDEKLEPSEADFDAAVPEDEEEISDSEPGLEENKADTIDRGKDDLKPPPTKKKEKKKNKLIGLRGNANTRARIAGIVIKKYGLKKGVTQDMINEVDSIYEKSNYRQSHNRLIEAWHSIQGYVNGLVKEEEQ